MMIGGDDEVDHGGVVVMMMMMMMMMMMVTTTAQLPLLVLQISMPKWLIQKDRQTKVERRRNSLQEVKGSELPGKLLCVHFSPSYDWIIWLKCQHPLTSTQSKNLQEGYPNFICCCGPGKKCASQTTCIAKIIWWRFHCNRSSMSSSEKDIHPQVEVQICPLFVGISVMDRNEQQQIKGRRNKSQTKRLSSRVMLKTINFPFHCTAESTLLPNGYI